ncbi:NAD(P)/FAD-dependent oxidoreductase [Streptomyces sp. ISL-22]|uniref:flavin-containing monooxygenase n=1 Tax=unclassified Streptomyces TaxID=2593676 RepID=UPI001BEB0CBF|nr:MULTISPECIES: NAD(P)/FAD-dependent oxidoreductase [unclassified Streptomyces]MBT2418864.1 NAD(P)/FAD-dependent oxidoreductase [Streptomyces sp. ISL-24]MBT2435703.1 NAD(P)/FAD-dependent oxidoreductase [Streptomyces sp. ISL-22]
MLIIGAGLSGLGLGMALKRSGHHHFTILEKADDIGGVWRDNIYPGAACDIPAHLYSYSFEPRNWTQRYAGQREILDYLRGCADKHGLDEHLRLGTEVRRADFDEGVGRWRVRTGTGEILEADVLVPACGQLNQPFYPDIPGADRFTGKSFHSARWDHSYDLRGRRVAVIGTGASAIQIVPQVAAQAAHLTVFQRSAPYIVPRWDRAYRRRSAGVGRLAGKAARLGWWLFNESAVPGLTRRWPISRLTSYGCAAQLERQVHDPSVRERLTPQDEVGCKRIGISSDYYPTFNQPHVELVTDTISEITEHGVRTGRGAEHRVDAIIYATGFCATNFLASLRITGRGRRVLSDTWRDGARAHLGMTVPGFPNMFLLYGPHTNVGAGSVVYMVESQIRYILDALRLIRRGRRRHLEVRPETEASFTAEMRRRLSGTVWATCRNWYRGTNEHVTTNWPGQTTEYRRRTRRVNLAHYQPGG